MDISRRDFLLGSAALGASAILPSIAMASGELEVIGGNAFGTYWRAVMPKGVQTKQLDLSARALVKRITNSMSPYDPESELSRFNRSAANVPFATSHDLEIVTKAALDCASHSHGAFDPTVGPSVHRYGFGPITGSMTGDYTQISISGHDLQKGTDDLTLDLCGIAKGYALDLMAETFVAKGVSDFLIEIGGEVIGRGVHPSGRPWRTGVETPLDAPEVPFAQILELDGLAIATSGDSVNGYKFAGTRYSHIINPHKARPVDGDIASVSVLAPSAMTADGYSTALMAMGKHAGPVYAEEAGLPTLFLVHEGEGIRALTTGGFDAHVVA